MRALPATHRGAPMSHSRCSPEQLAALDATAGSWAILRHGRPSARIGMRTFRSEALAREAWTNVDVRQGWAWLVNPDRCVCERQSGPWLRTRW